MKNSIIWPTTLQGGFLSGQSFPNRQFFTLEHLVGVALSHNEVKLDTIFPHRQLLFGVKASQPHFSLVTPGVQKHNDRTLM